MKSRVCWYLVGAAVLLAMGGCALPVDGIAPQDRVATSHLKPAIIERQPR